MDSHFRGSDEVDSFKLSALSLKPINGYRILNLMALGAGIMQYKSFMALNFNSKNFKEIKTALNKAYGYTLTVEGYRESFLKEFCREV